MQLLEALTNKKQEILKCWIDRTLDSYLSPGFFKTAKDPFANPVGSSITAGLTTLLDLLFTSAEPQAFIKPVDQVVRIRAVQDFTPAQAVAPFLELKWIVRQVLAGDRRVKDISFSLDTLDCEIDRMALTAFDIYSECREQLYRNRIQELKSGRALLTDAGCPSALLRRNLEDSETAVIK
ncbi:RsbRD N-terminal domain-containing protein [Desulfobulbus oligotrophicus]|jgi:hypothetical protein|uniref:RsbRD N-terminal domain-containing protein n=1 Tax=Desulfobulbus oligotrophicus TaxID=1909699 RepID=A0A7T6AQ32_9BACT|nr:RsbRD N-terminal domain-containing protein [Desulfobulbus oligotrophicus]MDY0391217.1 RsbRD N-terminal domain-containing protein [Desulfobulbus oligotrophicus]QQG65286.1 RsbRD N-terminal domain-containing protein [Desulfobulbus oligotrophicus]